MNNRDIINDGVILSLEDGRDLMKKMRRKPCERGTRKDCSVYCFALTMLPLHKMLVQKSHLL